MENVITLKRGLDLKLQGGLPEGAPERTVAASVVAVTPDDFPGFIPKLEVKEGDAVGCGAPLMHDKVQEGVKLVSPVTGVVEKVVRGERRKILRVEVRRSADAAAPVKLTCDSGNADAVSSALAASGLWAMMRQRPYDIVPRAGVRPRDIFVTAFDSAPLAPELEKAVAGRGDDLAAGVKALKLLTDGNIYISTRPDSAIDVPAEAVHYIINGPHPAGNAGVQAANIAPVNKGEVIWTLDVVTLARIGRLMRTGEPDWAVCVAVTGSEIEHPCMVRTTAGVKLSELIDGNVKADGRHHRIISGNVLTGVTAGGDGYLHYPYRQVTVIPEGDDADEFMGWASMRPGKMSVNRSFPSHFLPGRRFAPDARLLGGRRAMIMSGVYDSMLPMDILPEYLLKAIMSRDIDKMEALGIYEVAPEDFALCEYADPSKIEVQREVREGLDYLRKELD
ncbi:MAG: Na(+)-translocating NADH-quinone reductase subunit A [Muribaculaceae bacterium]|nr:Na(+)-translocating NADH-quinone reductase subunit A [Muribaculaceae bacterium]